MMKKKAISMVLCGLVGSGCVSVQTYRTSEKAKPGSACSAEVLFTPPAFGAYETIGVLNAFPDLVYIPSTDVVIEEVRKAACAEGADAVYVTNAEFGQCNARVLGTTRIDGVLLKRVARDVPTAAPAPMEN